MAKIKITHHFLAFFSASISAVCIMFMLVSTPQSVFPTPNLDIQNYNKVSKGMNSGIITVFGSSEMFLNYLTNLPSKFFKREYSEQVNQVPGVLIQASVIEARLLALLNEDSLENARVVVIVSPEWFIPKYENGTSVKFFKREFNQKYLYEYYFSTFVPTDKKNKLMKFFNSSHKHKSEEAIQSWIDQTYVKRYISLFDRQIIDAPKKYNYFKTVKNFNKQFNAGIELEKSYSNGNVYGISELPLIIRGHEVKKNKIPVKRPVVSNLGENKALEDFYQLMEVLTRFKIKPLIVIPDLNHHGYLNKHLLNPLVKRLEAEVHNRNFHLLKLWTNSITEYKQGIMTDVWHLGEAGWIRVNESIYDSFFLGRHE